MKINASRNRHQNRDKPPRISISQAEITADLLYPASPRPVPAAGDRRARGARR